MKKLIFVFVGIMFVFLCMHLCLQSNYEEKNPRKCYTYEIKRIIGSSLEPVFKNGEEVLLLANFYACNLIKKGDYVAIKFKTRNEILVKKVVGIFFLKEQNSFYLSKEQIIGKVIKVSSLS